VGGYRLDPAVKPRDDSTKNILWARSGDIFARARHLPAQSLSVYKIREGFAQADNEAIVKIAPLLAHKKKHPAFAG
jgi:hypothetical protein